jgi:hypothetical protein
MRCVGAGEHAQHAGRSLCSAHVYRQDFSMRLVGAQEEPVGLTGRRIIGRIASLARHQTLVFTSALECNAHNAPKQNMRPHETRDRIVLYAKCFFTR